MSQFLFNLPTERIARFPRAIRSQSRLMVVDPQSGSFDDQVFSSLSDYVRSDDLLVFNRSMVIPARLLLRKETGGKVEFLLERARADNTALALLKSNNKMTEGMSLFIEGVDDIRIDIESRQQSMYVVRLHGTMDWQNLLDSYGQIPLPPYMQRQANAEDTKRYQTVYADAPGSVAAPTAGLHFDDSIFQKLREKGINCAWLSLHVGYGTFAPLRSDAVDTLHTERFALDSQCRDAISATKKRGGRVIAVGTTTTRVLETLMRRGGIVVGEGETDIFIKPGFSFGCVDAMVTNFHLPGSSLMYLVAAFMGESLVMQAYNHAIAKEYSFYSYGDAMLIQSRE